MFVNAFITLAQSSYPQIRMQYPRDETSVGVVGNRSVQHRVDLYLRPVCVRSQLYNCNYRVNCFLMYFSNSPDVFWSSRQVWVLDCRRAAEDSLVMRSARLHAHCLSKMFTFTTLMNCHNWHLNFLYLALMRPPASGLVIVLKMKMFSVMCSTVCI